MSQTNTKVFTFGLGSGVDRDLCEGTAKAGRGTCSIVPMQSADLNGLVVNALNNAQEPGLKNCWFEWGTHQGTYK